MLHAKRPISLLGAAAIALVVAGCASQGGASSPPSSAPQASSSPGASSGARPSDTAYTVDLHQDAALGAFLTGEDGMTLYLLTKDGPGTSNCVDSCAKAWPPFILEDGESVVAGTGVTGTLSAIKRPDGTDQVAINGVPLYYFAGDSGAAQTSGQGVNGVWFVVSSSGTALGAPAASPAGTPKATEQSDY